MSALSPSNVLLYPATGRLRALPRAARHIMIVDDHPRFPGLLKANLNILHNYASDITVTKSLGKALDELRAHHPDLLFVSDELRPGLMFGQIQRYIRQTGYTGPVIACVSQSTGGKRQSLIAGGATYILDRSETHTASVIALLSHCLADDPTPTGTPNHCRSSSSDRHDDSPNTF